MRSTITTAAIIVAAGLATTGCSSSSSSKSTPVKPVISAAAACKDFTNWYIAVGANVTSTKDLNGLNAAVSAAPSGQLYQDLSTFHSDLITTAGAPSSLQTAEWLMTKEAALTVAQYCDSVNPNS